MLAAAAVVDDYGVTWDEPFHDAFARGAWARIGTWWSDPEAIARWNFHWYGGWFDALAILAGRVLPLEPWTARHLFNALTGVAGVAATAALGRVLGGPACGFVAALLLALTPPWIGHAFNNPKDVPFAAACAWATWTFARAAALPDPRAGREAALVGVAWGMALGARVAAGVLLPAAVWALRRRPRVLVAAAAVAYMVMLVGWPYAMARPLLGPWRAAAAFARYDDAAHAIVLFNGRWYRAGDLPRLYAPGYLGVMLPEPALLGLAGLAGLVFVRRRVRRTRHRAETSPALPVVLLAAGVPMVWLVVGRPVLYDGGRHLLFLFPPGCALGALGLVRLAAPLPRRAAATRWAAAAAAAAWIAAQAATIARLHPHEAVGYNAFTGGLRGAAGRWTLDVWGNAYREAVAALAMRPAAARPLRLVACPPHGSVDRELPAWIRRVPAGEEADWHLSLTARPCPAPSGRDEIIVARFGVPLAVARRLR